MPWRETLIWENGLINQDFGNLIQKIKEDTRKYNTNLNWDIPNLVDQ